MLGAFVIWELHLEQPMLDMHYFAERSFSAGSAGTILSFCALFGTMFLLTQYFQLVLGYSPLSAALRLLPMTPIMILVSPLTPRLAGRFGSNRTVAAGMALLTMGLLMFRGLELRSSYPYVLASLIPLVVGFSLILAPLTDADHEPGARTPRGGRIRNERCEPRVRRSSRRGRSRKRGRLALRS